MRKLKQVLHAHKSSDGDGVKINRLAGKHLLPLLNPFLMVDEIRSDDAADYIGGFPEHPHRGFETITYMKAGRMRHRDHMANEGVISAGDVQWMTAGAGVLHSEMPEQTSGFMHGFQIWLNLPAKEKMQPAAYREIASHHITEHGLANGGLMRVIAGRIKLEQDNGKEGILLTGPITEKTTQPVFVDVMLAANETIKLSFNEACPAIVYIYEGATKELKRYDVGLYEKGSTLSLAASDVGAKMLVLSGEPIQEPIEQYGPFVMNTMEEIERALRDFQNPTYIRGLKSGEIK